MNFSETLGFTKLIQELGWNAASVGAIGSIVLSLAIAITKSDQAYVIFRDRSAQVVSPLFAGVFSFLYLASLAYGLSNQSLPFVAQGVFRGLTTLPLLLGVVLSAYYWKQTEPLDWRFFSVTLIGIILFLAITILPWKQEIFAIFFLFALPVALDQPRLLYQEKHRGDLRPLMILGFVLNNTFWFVYVLATGKWALSLLMCAFFTIAVITLALWIYYPPKPEKSTEDI